MSNVALLIFEISLIKIEKMNLKTALKLKHTQSLARNRGAVDSNRDLQSDEYIIIMFNLPVFIVTKRNLTEKSMLFL
jgi:hypothetical protein